ncbi:unnamed protein product [Closterium sp. NIES-64]|nr:unnamed protein product [Closterium sp. NIES-64]
MELSVNATEIASLPSIQEVGDEECPAAVPLALPCSRTTSSETIQPTMLGNHPSLKGEGFRAMMRDVGTGLLEGHVPHLTSDGSGGTYLMSDASGASTVAVFKPMDEEPLAVNCPRGMAPSLDGEGLKRGTRVGEGAFREVAAYLLDHPLNEGDSEGYASVPPTTLVGCSASFFPRSDSPRSPLDDLEGKKVGSLQKFVQSFSNCEDMGPSRFPASEVHKIAVLDMRLANTDRNGANILVQRVDGPSGVKLIPIDHGYCIPDKFEDCTFEWLYWPQSKVPFAEETLEYISKLNANKDIQILKESGWSLNPACIKVLQAATMLLKKGASVGKTPFEIGSMMVRDDLDVPSLIESLVEEAESQAQRVGNQSFEACFEAIADYANQGSVPPNDTWKESKPLLPLSEQARNATVRSGVTSFFRVPSTCGAASGAAGGGEGRGAGAAAGWNTGVGGSGGDARWYVNVEIWGLFAPGNDTSVFYLPMLMLNSAGEVPTVLVTNTLEYRLDNHTSIDYPNFRSGQPYQIVSVPQDDLVKNGSVNATELIVGIFSDSYIAEGQDLGFSIRAFCSQGRGCPLNCSGRGVCGGGGVCQCPKGWGGTACADGETLGMGAGLRRMQVRMGVKVCGEGGAIAFYGLPSLLPVFTFSLTSLSSLSYLLAPDARLHSVHLSIDVVNDIQPGLQTLAPGQWAFFQIEPLDDMTFESTQKSLPSLSSVTQPSTKLLIQMERAAGDLVLFAKRQEQGFLPFGMPTVFDFNGFADMDSFRQRLDRHQIVWNRTEPGIVLVAVLNNDVDLRETGRFRLEYRLAVGREGRALCPWDCGWPAGAFAIRTLQEASAREVSGGGCAVLVAVLNNDVDLRETGGFCLEYRLAVGREGRALCPWDCGWPAGFCQALAVDGGGGGGGGGGDGGAETQCVCNPHSAGSFCQGGLHTAQLGKAVKGVLPPSIRLQTAELGKAVKGVLPPGRWTYVQFTFDPTTNKQIVISFTRKGGQASLVARQAAVPSLLDNDYRFTVRVTNDTLVSLFDVVNSSLEGPYTFGIFNLNYYVHQQCEFELEFKYKDSPSFFDSPYIIVIYAVLAFLLLVLIVIVLRCVIRRPPPAAADVELSALGDMDRHVEAVPTGVDRALVESFPLVKFRDDLFESSDDAHCAVCLADYDEQESLRKLPACSHYFFILIPLPLCAPPSPPFSPSPRSCAVCLADYDEQESLRKLPACSHYFHVSCIGEWLRTRCSCPLCRRYVLLQPPQPQQPEQPQQAAQPSALQAEQAGPLTQPTQAEQNSRRCAEEGQSEQLLPTQLGQSNESEIIQGAGEDCAVQRNGCGGVVSAKEQQGEAQVDLKQRLQENHQQRHEEQVDGERDGQWHEEERLMKREGEEGMMQEACEGENDVIYNPEPALEGLLERDGRQHGERHGEVNADRAEHACISRMP